jgi:hypothetical protein
VMGVMGVMGVTGVMGVRSDMRVESAGCWVMVR